MRKEAKFIYEKYFWINCLVLLFAKYNNKWLIMDGIFLFDWYKRKAKCKRKSFGGKKGEIWLGLDKKVYEKKILYLLLSFGIPEFICSVKWKSPDWKTRIKSFKLRKRKVASCGEGKRFFVERKFNWKFKSLLGEFLISWFCIIKIVNKKFYLRLWHFCWKINNHNLLIWM